MDPPLHQTSQIDKRMAFFSRARIPIAAACGAGLAVRINHGTALVALKTCPNLTPRDTRYEAAGAVGRVTAQFQLLSSHLGPETSLITRRFYPSAYRLSLQVSHNLIYKIHTPSQAMMPSSSSAPGAPNLASSEASQTVPGKLSAITASLNRIEKALGVSSDQPPPLAGNGGGPQPHGIDIGELLNDVKTLLRSGPLPLHLFPHPHLPSPLPPPPAR